MKFQCGHCGRVLRVADAQAGRKGKCPRCKQVVTIPLPVPEDSVTEGQPSSSDEVTAEASPRDGLLLDMPPADATSEPAAEPETAEEAYRKLRAMYGGRVMEPEEIPQRKLPWIVDIFLYPMSKSGLLILSLSAGIPLVLRIVLKFFKIFSAAFPPMMTFWILTIIAHCAAFAMFLWYMVWYGCQCIRDSAEIAKIDLGVAALATNPRKSNKNGDGDTTISVSFAGVTIRPGQYIYADEDGWLVAERALHEQT